MIEITSAGGRIGRICWENSSASGFFPRFCQPASVLRPGSCWWDEPWPKRHLWPISPWGPGDAEQHDGFADFVAFEEWVGRQDFGLDAPDLDVIEKVWLYALCCKVFDSGIAAGRNPWRTP